MKVSHQEKIIALWAAFLFGTLFHTQLALIPLFHGLNVAHSTASSSSEIAPVLWSMLGFFILPMFAIVITAFHDSKRYRVFHFGLTVLYTVMNFLHLVLDLGVQPIVWSQITLMAILLGLGLVLNIAAFQWMQYRPYRLRAPNLEESTVE